MCRPLQKLLDYLLKWLRMAKHQDEGFVGRYI